MTKKEWERRRLEEAKPAYEALMKFYPLTVDDLEGEVWKPIAGYEELYHESNFGRTKSFWNGKVKIRRPAFTRGYLFVTLYKDGEHKSFRVNRLVALTFIPNPENKPEVNHKDANRFNNYVENLEWVTGVENQQHAVDMGLQAQGGDRPDAKLTNEQARYIRNNPDGLTARKLAEQFGVHFVTISEIQLGKKYKTAGGVIREKSEHPHNYISDEIRDQIRADWATGQYSQHALARKNGVSQTTIRNIIHEK